MIHGLTLLPALWTLGIFGAPKLHMLSLTALLYSGNRAREDAKAPIWRGSLNSFSDGS